MNITNSAVETVKPEAESALQRECGITSIPGRRSVWTFPDSTPTSHEPTIYSPLYLILGGFVHPLRYVLSEYSIHFACTNLTTDFITVKYLLMDEMSQVSAEVLAEISARMDEVDVTSCSIIGPDTVSLP